MSALRQQLLQDLRATSVSKKFSPCSILPRGGYEAAKSIEGEFAKFFLTAECPEFGRTSQQNRSGRSGLLAFGRLGVMVERLRIFLVLCHPVDHFVNPRVIIGIARMQNTRDFQRVSVVN